MAGNCFELHGFNVKDAGNATTDRADRYLEAAGLNVIDVDYGFFDLIDVRERTEVVVNHLLQMVRPGDTFFAHSHGCAIVALAIEKGAPFRAGVMVHPALKSYWKPPAWHAIKGIAVFSNVTDYATWSAFLLRMFSPGNLIWGRHVWGAMGSTGPLSKDPRMLRHEGAKGHSSGFAKVEEWGPKWSKAMVDILDAK